VINNDAGTRQLRINEHTVGGVRVPFDRQLVMQIDGSDGAAVGCGEGDQIAVRLVGGPLLGRHASTPAPSASHAFASSKVPNSASIDTNLSSKPIRVPNDRNRPPTS